jgi:hypothetical protein
MNRETSESAPQRYCRRMTVAHIRFGEHADYDEVMFLESARFYRLVKRRADYGSMLEKLRKAQTDALPVMVCFASFEADVIEEVG